MLPFLSSLGTWGPCFLPAIAVSRKPYCASDGRSSRPFTSSIPRHRLQLLQGGGPMGHICYHFLFYAACVFRCPLSLPCLAFQAVSHLMLLFTWAVSSWVTLMEAVLSPAQPTGVSLQICLTTAYLCHILWVLYGEPPFWGGGLLLYSKPICHHCSLDTFVLGSYHTKLFPFSSPPLRHQKCCCFPDPRTKDQPFLKMAFSQL